MLSSEPRFCDISHAAQSAIEISTKIQQSCLEKISSVLFIQHNIQPIYAALPDSDHMFIIWKTCTPIQYSVAKKSSKAAARHAIPDLQCPISRSTDNPLPVRTDYTPSYGVCMTHQRQALLTRLRVPHLQRPVQRGADDPAPIRANCTSVDRIGVTL